MHKSVPNILDYTKDTDFYTESKFKSDDCFKIQNINQNSSIFQYMTDTNMFINNDNCLDSTPPFLNYISSGIPLENVDIENDLRGINRNNSRCSSKKWQSPNPGLAEIVSNQDFNTNNKNICNDENKILKNGYFKDPILKWDGYEFTFK